MRRWLGALTMLTVVAASAAAGGCNAITGADDLVLVPGEGDGGGQAAGQPAPDDPGSTGTGAGQGTGGGGTGAGQTGTSDPPPGPMAKADGVTIADLDLYQALRRPIVSGGGPAASDIPIVAGRDAMLRIFYATDGGYNGQPVTARLTLGGQAPIEKTGVLAGASVQHQLGSTVNLDIPGALLTVGASFKVELLQPTASTGGGNVAAAYPKDGQFAPLAVEQGGVKLKVRLVPVSNYGSLPDTSPEQLQRYHDWFLEQYPIPEVEISVRSGVHTFNGDLGSYWGWSDLLDEVTNLRDTDNAPGDVYYYGIHAADGNGLLGLGWVGGPTDVWSRTAIGVGWTGDTAAETATHEVGHNHGRDHSPCGVDGDPAYPHAGAVIGVWGYWRAGQKLLDPNQFVDLMSYCSPTWISDYTFKAIFKRLKIVSTQPELYVPGELRDRTYDRVRIIEGVAKWRPPVKLSVPPMGEKTVVKAWSLRGESQLEGHYYPYDHLAGGTLYIMRPAHLTLIDEIHQVQLSVEGKSFTLSR